MNRYILGDLFFYTFINKYYQDNPDGGLIQACQRGNLDLAEWMIQKGANCWNLGLWGACWGGHQKLALLMIQKGADDENFGLWGACLAGHRELAEWMIQKRSDPKRCANINVRHCHPLL
jgi:hypothetical protein